jgi:hypothetical protein
MITNVCFPTAVVLFRALCYLASKVSLSGNRGYFGFFELECSCGTESNAFRIPVTGIALEYFSFVTVIVHNTERAGEHAHFAPDAVLFYETDPPFFLDQCNGGTHVCTGGIRTLETGKRNVAEIFGKDVDPNTAFNRSKSALFSEGAGEFT